MAEISAEIAGKVLEVLVQPGDEVVEDQEVLILESMKMHIPVVADRAGKVAQVRVQAGDLVNQGDPLLILE